MIARVSDPLVEQIDIRWADEGSPFIVEINFDNLTDSHQRVVASFLYISEPRDLRYIAENVAKRQSFSLDMRGFSYPNPDAAEPTEYTRFEGVHVHIYGGSDQSVNLSEAAFIRLILRLLRVVIDGATRTAHPMTRESWWSDFLKHADMIARHTHP
jgi:hypothetical protein